MVAFIASLVATAVMMAILFWVAKRRDPKQPLTWAEAFLASVFVFTLMLVVYGIVPNQWLLWADNELNWRKDAFFFGENGIQFFGRGRILIPKEVLRDIIASVIYVVALVAHVWIWLWWQKRGKAKPGSMETKESAFGRPLLVRPRRSPGEDASGGLSPEPGAA
jgi:hypothetical protein